MSQPKTVLITGGSSGIGYALVKRFAKENYKIIAVGRDKLKLEALATECLKEYNERIEVISQELSDQGAVNNIIAAIKNRNLDIDILVNGAGFGMWGSFAYMNKEDITKMIQVHINSLINLCHAILPSMIERGHGSILNIGSVYCYSAVPYQTVYAATKAFMYSFSQGLLEEVKNKNIHISLLCPGSTHTNFRSRANIVETTNSTYMSADEVADIAYKGLMQNKKIIVPGFFNKFSIVLLKILPLTILMQLIYKLRGMNHFEK